MKEFQNLCATAAVIPGKNIDTDQIIPARFLKLSRGEGLDEALFHDLRFSRSGEVKTNFILNQDSYSNSQILIVDHNFGCGSSREAAVYALVEFGIKALISLSFGDIFHNNCLKNGILPIVLDEKKYAQVLEMISESRNSKICISLENNLIYSENKVQNVSFEIEGFWRECLLKGIDDLELTLSKMPEIQKFEEVYRHNFPWQFINTKIEAR